jgi:nucleotide-binding universal stress UspA family protein
MSATLAGILVALQGRMAKSKEFRVLIASDGSLSATAAVVTARRFPWPEGTLAFGVIVPEGAGAHPRRATSARFDQAAKVIAENTAAALLRRWPDVRVRVVEGPTVGAIVRRAKMVRANVVVLGWRGHGAVRRLLAGSVSRGVVRHAPCPVLVVRRAISDVEKIVIGFDGSEQARRAVAFVARLAAPASGSVMLLTAADTQRMPSHSLLPSDFRGTVAAEVARANRRSVETARAQLDLAAGTLRAAGWKTQTRVTTVAPLESLLAAVNDTDANLLVVGARGATGVERLLLGSVAEGALDRSPVPILIVR